MRKAIAAAALAAFALPAQADDVLEGYSYACKHKSRLDELGAAKWAGDQETQDELLARKHCFLINRTTPVYVVFEENDKAFFRSKENPAVKLWTWSRNIGRGR